MKKTSFLALLGKKFPEKLSRLSVKGGEGVPPISAKGFLEKWFSANGVGETEKIRQVVFDRLPYTNIKNTDFFSMSVLQKTCYRYVIFDSVD